MYWLRSVSSNPCTRDNIPDRLVVDADRGLFSLNICDLFSNLWLARKQEQVTLAISFFKFSLQCSQRIQMCRPPLAPPELLYWCHSLTSLTELLRKSYNSQVLNSTCPGHTTPKNRKVIKIKVLIKKTKWSQKLQMINLKLGNNSQEWWKCMG